MGEPAARRIEDGGGSTPFLSGNLEPDLKRIATSILRHLGYEIRRLPPNASPSKPRIHAEYQRLERAARAMQVVKLHFGCGPRILRGWINIDVAYEPFEGYLKYYTDEFYDESVRGGREDFFELDITEVGLPLPDHSADVVFHEDFIEHLDQKKQVLFLAETLRVLKRNAIHRVSTPDLLDSMNRQSRFQRGIAGVFAEEWDKHGHKNVLTRKTLQEMALMVGYSHVTYTTRGQSQSTLVPKEYRPANDRPLEGNLFADLVA